MIFLKCTNQILDLTWPSVWTGEIKYNGNAWKAFLSLEAKLDQGEILYLLYVLILNNEKHISELLGFLKFSYLDNVYFYF